MTIVESGFDRIPLARRAEAFKMNDGGWTGQIKNIEHLDTLEAAGVVRSNRSGRERIWEIETARLAKARRCLDDIGAQWDAALERLSALVEE